MFETGKSKIIYICQVTCQNDNISVADFELYHWLIFWFENNLTVTYLLLKICLFSYGLEWQE